MVPVTYYLALSAIMFVLGILGVLLRRNALVVLGNVAAPDDTRVLTQLSTIAAGDDALLAEHAAWALERLAARAEAAGNVATEGKGFCV